MLLIGDLHINSRIKDTVIGSIKKYVQENADEKNIIFLGDYVYHFSYDRVALLELYNLFLELFSEGKNVYVLAGNHDWIGNTFVFQEAKRTFETINEVKSSNLNVQNDGKIEFITKPKVENIEGDDVLFLPYFIEVDELDFLQDKTTGNDSIREDVENIIKKLSESKNKNEKISAKVNQILLNYLNKYEKLTVIHHYYVEGINFPGQRGRFYFNDIALSKRFCDLTNVKMISGHLHQGFVYKNYFCTGSVWSTSPLEINQIKSVFRYFDGLLKGKMIFVNPYLLVDNGELEIDNKVDLNYVKDFLDNMINDNQKNYSGSEIRNIEFDSEYKIENKDISISIKVEDVNYDEIYNYVDENLFKNLKDVKLKKNIKLNKELFEKLDLEGKNLSNGFSDRKGLLKDFLKIRYLDEVDKYLDFLKKEKIL